MNYKRFTKTILTSFLFLVAFTLISNKASAVSPEEICQPDVGLFERIQKGWKLDIRRTVVNQLTSSATDGMFLIATGADSGSVFKCVGQIDGEFNVFQGSLPPECQPVDAEAQAFCANLMSSYQDDVNETNLEYDTERFKNFEQAGGSLAYVSNGLNRATKEPLPVNLAFYANKQIERVPYMGTAFAQTTSYSGPLLNITYTLWKVVRDASYGLIAIIMIITGVLIMTQKKVNAQTMVTVQYAIPRIIIALVLITFSYPIGATLASIGWALRGSAVDIINSLATVNLASQSLTGADFMQLVILVQYVVIAGTGGAGAAIMILGGVGLVVALLVRIIVSIKILLIYLNIIVMAVSSPFTFAMGAIPGNENLTTDWFKKILLKMGSMLGMRAVVALTNLTVALVLEAVLIGAGDINNFSISSAGAFGELGLMLVFAPIVFPFIFAFGYYQAWQIPKKLEAAFMGKPKR